MRHDTIAARLIVVTRLSAALVFALALGVVEFRSRAMLEVEVAGSARHFAAASVSRIETMLAPVAKVAEGLRARSRPAISAPTT